MLNTIKAAKADPAVRRMLSDPYLLCPPAARSRPKQNPVTAARYDASFNSWSAPFVMAVVNEAVVQRSNALLQPGYSDDFHYNEGTMTGPKYAGRSRATAMALGMSRFITALSFSSSRWVLERLILPRPGKGPSPEARQKGFFVMLFQGETSDGKSLTLRVSGDRDPGYGSTAKMLAQAAICLAKDISKTDKPGGFWTPATLFGDLLIQRLRDHAGLTFELSE